VELVPSQALPERNFKQSSPSAFGGPHLFDKCGTLAYAIRDARSVTLLRAAALKENEKATSRSRPVALTRNAALLASLSDRSVEPKRLWGLFSSHSLTRVDDSSCLGLAFMHNLKVPGIQIQADVLSNLLRIKGTDKLGWNGEQPMRSALFCINRLAREDCAEDSRLLS